MATHIVKCLYCGKTFDAKIEEQDKVWFKPRSNRYAHIECGKQYENSKTQEEKDFDTFYNYVKREQGSNFNFVKFKKTVEAWKKDYNYTYHGMYCTLIYFYEVKKNPKTKFLDGSIGIIPFCYKEAEQYYYNIYMAAQRAEASNYNGTLKRIIEMPPPAAKQKLPKLFNLDMEEDDEE